MYENAINTRWIKIIFKNPMRNKLILIAVIFLLSTYSFSQEIDSINKATIQVQSNTNARGVILRWAPNNATAWLLGNKYGYMIERFTFLNNGKLIKERNKMILTTLPLKPWPVEKWEKMTDTSDFAAVAAQAIYGTDFDVDVNKSTSMYSIFNKAKQTESRFTFALHSANQSIEIASASALSFVDTTTKTSEAYLYRIFIPVPKNIMQLDTAKIFVNAGKRNSLPKIREVMSETSDNCVMLSWNSKLYERDYVSYIVERSDDGGHNYHLLSVRPFVSIGNDNAAIPGSVIYLDSVPNYNFKYYYHIRGKSIFAEIGPPSDSIKVTALKKLFSCPSIKSFQIIKNKVVLAWEMPENNKDAIMGFSVERASNPQATYIQLNKSLLSSEARMYTDTIPISSNYYLVNAIDKQGRRYSSLPYFVQLQDSTPPLPPLGLSGKIDTSGNVNISWKKNPEADILGYRIFRSYFKNAEFVQITSNPVKQNFYTEKINLKNLNKFIYYKIIASDTHFNLSQPSNIIQVRQPDIIAPSAPVISNIKSTEQGIFISIIPSNSIDVEKYIIYRKDNTDSLWILQSVIPYTNNTMEYNDSIIKAGIIYNFNVIAVDSSGNESQPFRSVSVKAIKHEVRKDEITFKLNKDIDNKVIEIKWFTDRTDITEILIYKTIDNEPISQYISRPAKINTFSDHNVKPKHKYQYMIKAMFLDGTESNLSKMEEVNYE